MDGIFLSEPIIFEWDDGNRDKNFIQHEVSFKECEEAFSDSQKKLFYDPKHSLKESRYLLFGKTENNKLLTIAFTIRNTYIRVISARDMSKKERYIYEKASKNSQIQK